MLRKYRGFIAGVIGITLMFIFYFQVTKKDHLVKNKEVEVALREVGNQLLLDNGDSTSLVLPIQKLDYSTYELTFQSELSIVPDSLVATVSSSLSKVDLPLDYLVEVQDNNEDEIVYGYKMSPILDESLVPCLGRSLPQKSYAITVTFLDDLTGGTSYAHVNKQLIFPGIFIILLLAALVSLATRDHSKPLPHSTKLGEIKFDLKVRTLSFKNTEISLSKTECELLSFFAQKANQVITRDELLKEIWENKGVVVSRSLDTFISRLRKKLVLDSKVNIKNFHGKGYMLEIQS